MKFLSRKIFLHPTLLSKHTEKVSILLVLIAGLLLLYGRFDWSAQVNKFSLRGYLSSAYLFALTIPSLFFLLKALFPQHNKWIWGLTLTTAAWFSLPYKWLKLDLFYYNRQNPVIFNSIDWNTLGTNAPNYTGSPPPSTNWLPEALFRWNDMPHEALFFLVLIFFAFLVVAAGLRLFSKSSPENVGKRKLIWLGVGLFLLILLQTYFHLSLRSPYVYLTHYERPLEQNYWYVNFMFPDNQGAVNADLAAFRTIEDHFTGIPYETSTILIRRAYLFYFSSQFSYFFGMYRVFLFLNILLWFIACVCAYLLGKSWWDSEVGIYMAFLMGCGPGFIMFVAQPMNYLPGYAIVIILIYLFERLISNQPDLASGRYLLFGSILGLGSMVYDIYPWFVFFIVYSLVKRQSFIKIVFSIGLAIIIFSGFLWIQTDILDLNMKTGNSRYLTEALNNILVMIQQGQIGTIYTLTITFLGNFINQLAQVFFVVPLILGVGGLFFIQHQPKIRGLSMLLLLPAILGFAFFHYGASYLATLPRLNFVAYPAVYLLAAGMLVEIRTYLAQRGLPKVGMLVVWSTLGFVFFLSNIDAFGILPQMYYLVYYSSGGFFK